MPDYDIRKDRSLLIKAGTPGEITGVSGATPSHYTVTVRPFGPDGATVTINNLTRIDLKEAWESPVAGVPCRRPVMTMAGDDEAAMTDTTEVLESSASTCQTSP